MLNKFFKLLSCLLIASVSTVLVPKYCYSLDTDAYQVNVKQNAYILLDNSGSMDYGVYESNVDYGAMYDYLYTKSNIVDTISDWYDDHYDPRKIFLAKGAIGASLIDGGTRSFTGDAANPDYVWYSNDMIDTHTYIDTNGNLSGEEGYSQRVTVDEQGYVLLDGSRLPLGQDLLLKDFKTLYDGTMINEGFGGILNAPGYHFSGFKAVGTNASGHEPVEHGNKDIYFFITGNWMNMQQMYNLHYSDDRTKPAWKYEEFPLESGDWGITTLDSSQYDWPEGAGDYANNQNKTLIVRHPGATKIQIHFSLFDIDKNGSGTSWSNYDSVSLYDKSSNLIAIYNNKYTYGDAMVGGWSPIIDGDTVTIKIHTNSSQTARGITIDQYKATEGGDDDNGSYLMQNRLDVAKDAIQYVLDEFRGKINWGFATFNYTGSGSGDGAKIYQVLNPSLNDDANRASIEAHLKNVEPKGGTPLGEALQDIFEDGYYKKRSVLSKLMCRRNFAIVLSDGFPSDDFDWSRTSFGTFTDSDGDSFTADPYQYPNLSTNYLPKNYYDDVATWISHHSWLDGEAIADEDVGNSYENIIPHQIAFGAKHPLMRNAAEESGAEYITAYNKTQLVNAFYSLGLMIADAISFTAPAVSVDAENKIQNGDELYMGLFLPRDSHHWVGNLKKFQFGNGAERSDFWGIYDAANNLATDLNGEYLNNTVGFWGDENDANDSDTNAGADIMEDGVGECLTERVQSALNSATKYEREIKFLHDGSLKDFNRTNITPTVLGLDASDTALRDKVVNWTYGYTFDANSDGNPVAARDWALGPIIHSRPVIIDYYQTDDATAIEHRYVAIGANDGMLHIFNDDVDGANDNGKELLAFIPADALTKLKNFETERNQPLVDGEISIIRKKPDGIGISQPKYLIFSQRRGGSSIIALDIENPDPEQWSFAWEFRDSEMVQSWSSVETARIRTGAGTGTDSYTNIGIFTGGYDPLEDNYPEPFNDLNNDGLRDTNEWSKTDNSQDLNGNNDYDSHNVAGDNAGRALYVVDLTTGNLLFSMKHCPEDNEEVTTGDHQTSKKFKYCFPAGPAVVVGDSDGVPSALQAIYTIDIYGNVFRFNYDYFALNSTQRWTMDHIFSVNPGSLSESGTMAAGNDDEDPWRKVFYSPAVSWRGSGYLFDTTNYIYPDVEFENTQKIATLFFGTGDREHPLYNVTHDRIYSVYDDSIVVAKNKTNSAIPVSSVPYSENDLLNLTCDELGLHTTKAGASADATLEYKTNLYTLLADDVLNQTTTDMPMELDSGGNGENDAKGWYIILDQQTSGSYCDHCDYKATIQNVATSDRDNHFGEKITSRLTLYAGVLYFTSYQRSFDDPCAPNGNGLTYAIDYTNGGAALNLNLNNDSHADPSDPDSPLVEQKDITDRYRKIIGIKALPTALSPVSRKGETYIPGFGKITNRDRPIYYWIEH